MKKIIKIFVCHTKPGNRLIGNKLFVNVLGGAALYDGPNGDSLVRDDSGDNISIKNRMFNEFTVQYWAWKNIDADYYGLCHYRRFLSFSKKKRKELLNGQVLVLDIDRFSTKYLGLDNPIKMERYIEKYDAIFNVARDVSECETLTGYRENIYEHWKSWEGIRFEKGTVDWIISAVKEFYPDYYDDVIEYLNQTKHRGYNCFIMKRALFEEMTKFEYDIMTKREKMINISGYTPLMQRTCGFICEILYGAFSYHIMKDKQYHTAELQLAYSNKDNWKEYVKTVVDPILPVGSDIREKLKTRLGLSKPI